MMIVRCTRCNTAYSVDDRKVENKKFAFSCPKCDSENIIDNRGAMRRADRGALRPTAAGRKARDEAFDERKGGFLSESGMAREPRESLDDVINTGEEFPAEDRLPVDKERGIAESAESREIEPSFEAVDLPPADDLSSELPLDDYFPDSGAKAEKTDAAQDKESTSGAEGTGLQPVGEESDQSVFEELGDISEYKSDNEMIKDEMDSESAPREEGILAESDNEARLSEDENVIIDEFEPLAEESVDESVSADGKSFLEEEIKTEEVFPKDHTKEEESITIDLDALDIDIDHEAENATKEKPGIEAEPPEAETHARSADTGVRREDDENITIDLDTLDLDVEEDKHISKGESREELDLDIFDFSEETIQELEDRSEKKEDEDMTLDLDSLDISLDESGETKEGEILNEDDKLTLADAGLSLDELTIDELSSVSGESEKIPEEDITLSFDEIDETERGGGIDRELEEAETVLSESPPSGDELLEDFDDLSITDIDIDLKDQSEEAGTEPFPFLEPEDELIAITDREKAGPEKSGLFEELSDVVPHGAVNFSIDYSIKNSRIGALLRLSGIFLIGLIPHFAVYAVYHMLSFILGVLNYIIIIFTGKNVEDFSEIQENSLRYALSLGASLMGVVDEMPVFAGRNNIDHPVQMKITYPSRYSKVLTFLRLTIAGIVLAVAPHLLVLSFLTLVAFMCSIAGIVSVLIAGRWPHTMFEFMTRYLRYSAKVLAFSTGVIDEYPSFTFN
jgi:hypothetical protein